MWFPNRPDTNRAVQSQKQARSLKFWIKEDEEVYYPCSENKGADQHRFYREADLRLWFCICILPDCWLIEAVHLIVIVAPLLVLSM